MLDILDECLDASAHLQMCLPWAGPKGLYFLEGSAADYEVREDAIRAWHRVPSWVGRTPENPCPVLFSLHYYEGRITLTPHPEVPRCAVAPPE